MSNLHTYCCCILPYNTKNNSLALLVLSGVEWAFWNNFVIFKTWKTTHLSRSLDLREKNETFNINNNQPVFQKNRQSTVFRFKHHACLMCTNCIFIPFYYIFLHLYTPWNKHYIMLSIPVYLCSILRRRWVYFRSKEAWQISWRGHHRKIMFAFRHCCETSSSFLGNQCLRVFLWSLNSLSSAGY